MMRTPESPPRTGRGGEDGRSRADAMTSDSVLTTLSFVTYSLILAGGIWLLAGWYVQDLWPPNVRYPLGAVTVLYAFYRIATTRSRFRRKESGDESDDDET